MYIVSGRKNSCLNPLNKRKPFIESEIPKNTLSGNRNWDSAEFCSMNSYAIWYDWKIEPNQGSVDDTGLNSICGQNKDIFRNQGAGRGRKYCETNKIKEFQSKSEPQ